jgi:hypothetical protein
MHKNDPEYIAVGTLVMWLFVIWVTDILFHRDKWILFRSRAGDLYDVTDDIQSTDDVQRLKFRTWSWHWFRAKLTRQVLNKLLDIVEVWYQHNHRGIAGVSPATRSYIYEILYSSDFRSK